MPLNGLVADDSVVRRAMVTRVLRVSGLPLASVREATDGAAALAALAALAAEPADLVALDAPASLFDTAAVSAASAS